MRRARTLAAEIRAVCVAGLSLGLIAGCEYAPLESSRDAGRDAGPAAAMDGGPAPMTDAGPRRIDAGPADLSDAGLGFDSIPSNVLLLIDRSGSMAQPSGCGVGACGSRWDQILALGGYLAEVKRGARLGAAFFPSTVSDGCAVDSYPAVPLGDDESIDEQIMSAARRTRPGGSTPLAAALDEMRINGGVDDLTRDNNLVILTDGHPNCACPGGSVECEREVAIEAVSALANADPPVDIYVIGFGSGALLGSAGARPSVLRTRGSSAPRHAESHRAGGYHVALGRTPSRDRPWPASWPTPFRRRPGPHRRWKRCASILGRIFTPTFAAPRSQRSP